jgi:hypothetical protein
MHRSLHHRRWPTTFALGVGIGLLLLLAGPAMAAKTGFGFNGTVSGFPTGAVRLTGGGAFDLTTGFVNSAGGFRCLEDVEQGPLTGCLAGEGVRWDTVELLDSTTFTCTGTDAVKTATTSDQTVVLLSDFYRAGDANDESFTAQIIISEVDIAPDIPGNQTLWIQGVGCGTAVVNFSN